MPQTASITAPALNLAIDHLGIAETLVAQLNAIVMLVPRTTPVGVLAEHCLALVASLHNDFDAAVEAQH